MMRKTIHIILEPHPKNKVIMVSNDIVNCLYLCTLL